MLSIIDSIFIDLKISGVWHNDYRTILIQYFFKDEAGRLL